MPRKAEVNLEEALRGAFLVLENGRALVEEAEILFEAGRYERTVALSVLAMEEFGKFIRMFLIDRFQAEGRMPAFWKYFREHETKSGLNALVTQGHRPDEPNLDGDWHHDLGVEMHKLKMQALYVDYVGSSFKSPREIPDLRVVAGELVEQARTALERHNRHWAAIDLSTYWTKKREVRERIDSFLRDPSLLDSFLAGRESEPAAILLRNQVRRVLEEDQGATE